MNSIEAKTIEDRAIVPLASFLHDCLHAIDPNYMETIVERFISTKEKTHKNDQLYKGAVSIVDDRGTRRTSLEQFDLLFLLQFFAFATLYQQKVKAENDWYPGLTTRYRFSKTARNKIVILKDKRNTSEHDRTERNRDHYLEILVSNFLDVFAHEIMVVIDKEPHRFSEQTKHEVREYVAYLRRLKQGLFLQNRRTIAIVTAIAVVVALGAALIWPSAPPSEVRPTRGLVFIACNGLSQFDSRQLVSEISKQCDQEVVISADVLTGSGVLWSIPVLSTNVDSLLVFIDQVRMRSDSMTDITQFSTSFDAAYLAMNKMHDHKITPRMVMLGHLPEITYERNQELARLKWAPSRIEQLISTWTNRKYASPLWIYKGDTHQVERSYVDSILIKSDVILTPEEHRL